MYGLAAGELVGLDWISILYWREWRAWYMERRRRSPWEIFSGNLTFFWQLAEWGSGGVEMDELGLLLGFLFVPVFAVWVLREVLYTYSTLDK